MQIHNKTSGTLATTLKEAEIKEQMELGAAAYNMKTTR
jgi:hypothetical protein